jgi:maleate cis-trans isomerase
MYAWRARLGLIQPTHRGKGFAFWYKHAPDGVEIVPTFIGFRRSDRETFVNAFDRAEEIAEDLVAVGCTAISIGGTPPFLLKGLDFEREWRQRLSERTGLPVITAMEPHAIALQAMGVKRAAVATYYGDELNQAIVAYLARFGIEGELMGGFSLEGQGQGLYTTNLQALDDVSWVQVYQYCKRAFQQLSRPVDAIYINGSGWDAGPAVSLLEADLKVKVLFAPAASNWFTYETLAIHHTAEDCGEILRGGYRLPG